MNYFYWYITVKRIIENRKAIGCFEMTFEWDENKNLENIEKHNVSFETAQEAFFDDRRIIVKDEKHSVNEERFYCIGNDGDGIITVRFTKRNGNTRIFGAGYWREGKSAYEEKYHLY